MYRCYFHSDQSVDFSHAFTFRAKHIPQQLQGFQGGELSREIFIVFLKNYCLTIYLFMLFYLTIQGAIGNFFLVH